MPTRTGPSSSSWAPLRPGGRQPAGERPFPRPSAPCCASAIAMGRSPGPGCSICACWVTPRPGTTIRCGRWPGWPPPPTGSCTTTPLPSGAGWTCIPGWCPCWGDGPAPRSGATWAGNGQSGSSPGMPPAPFGWPSTGPCTGTDLHCAPCSTGASRRRPLPATRPMKAGWRVRAGSTARPPLPAWRATGRKPGSTGSGTGSGWSCRPGCARTTPARPGSTTTARPSPAATAIWHLCGARWRWQGSTASPCSPTPRCSTSR